MIALSSIVLISTIGIREAGHVIASKFFNCQSKIILYEDGHYPHSELICPNEDGNILSLISGILLPLVIALVLLISGGIFMKEIALLIIGFDLLSSYQDFIDLGLNGNLILFTTLTGISFLFLGIMLLARTRMGDYD